MNAVMEPAMKTANKQNLDNLNNPFAKTILLSVTINMPGNTRKVSTEYVEADTDKSLLRVSKKILECPEFKRIETTRNKIRKLLRSKAVPGATFLKGGVYSIPITLLNEVDTELEDLIREFNTVVAMFLEVYEARREETIERLRALGDSRDYPSLERMKSAFGVICEYVAQGPPGSLKEVNADLWKQAWSKYQETCKRQAETVQSALREMFSGMVDHMLERLTPDKEGKRKIFHESTLDNFKEFFRDFKARNITEDTDLEQLVEKAEAVLSGRTRIALKGNELIRSQTAAKMAEIKSGIDALLKDAPSRDITLD